jgi:hypothetical protein
VINETYPIITSLDLNMVVEIPVKCRPGMERGCGFREGKCGFL